MEQLTRRPVEAAVQWLVPEPDQRLLSDQGSVCLVSSSLSCAERFARRGMTILVVNVWHAVEKHRGHVGVYSCLYVCMCVCVSFGSMEVLRAGL